MYKYDEVTRTAVLQCCGPHAELLWVCDQLSQLPLRQAVTVGVTLGSALRAGAVQASPPLPEERQTARARLRLRGHVLPQVRAGRVVWSKYVKLLGAAMVSQLLGQSRAVWHTYFEHLLLYDLLLPGDGDGARAELAVEVLVSLVETDALHGGELLDIQHILEGKQLLFLAPTIKAIKAGLAYLGVDSMRVRLEGRLDPSSLQPAPVN